MPLFSTAGGGDLSAALRSASAAFLSLAGIFLIGLHGRDLLLEHHFGADIFLGLRIEAAQHQHDVFHDVVVVAVVRKAVFLGDVIELRDHFGIRLVRCLLRQLGGHRIKILLRGQHLLDLLVSQRNLLWRRRILRGSCGGCRCGRRLFCGGLFLRLRICSASDGIVARPAMVRAAMTGRRMERMKISSANWSDQGKSIAERNRFNEPGWQRMECCS